MCSATLLPEPDRPLTKIRRMREAGTGLSGARYWRAARPSRAWWSLTFSLCFDQRGRACRPARRWRRTCCRRWRRRGCRAAHLQRRLGLVLQLLDRQHAVHVDDVVEMAHDPLHLLLHVARIAGVISTWWPVTFSCMVFSFQLRLGYCERHWRTLALVRRRDAHGFAVLRDRASRHRDALAREHLGNAAVATAGCRASPRCISLRILARMAVDEVPGRPRPRPGSRRNSAARTRRAACACTCRR